MDMAAMQQAMAGMSGGGQNPMAAMMQNPAMMQQAQAMMQNPAMMQQAQAMMQNPAMMQQVSGRGATLLTASCCFLLLPITPFVSPACV